MTLSLSIAVVPPSLQSKELISIPTPPTFVRLWLGDCWKQCTAQPECTWGNFISHWFRERECDLGNDKIIYLSNSQINSTASRGYHSLIIIRSPLQTILPRHAQKQKTWAFTFSISIDSYRIHFKSESPKCFHTIHMHTSLTCGKEFCVCPGGKQ